MLLDLCINYTIGNIKAVKFSDYLADLDNKKRLTILYETFLRYGFFCPEIARMKDKKGLRFRYKEETLYINATIFADTPEEVQYVWGNEHSMNKASSLLTEEDISKFLQTIKKKRKI